MNTLLCPGPHSGATPVKSPPSPLTKIMTWTKCGKITRFYCIWQYNIQYANAGDNVLSGVARLRLPGEGLGLGLGLAMTRVVGDSTSPVRDAIQYNTISDL